MILLNESSSKVAFNNQKFDKIVRYYFKITVVMYFKMPFLSVMIKLTFSASLLTLSFRNLST